MRDSENPDLERGRHKKEDRDPQGRKRTVIGVTVSVVLLIAILLVAFFVTPIVARQTSGEILPDTVTSIIIESGDAKIEMGSRSELEVIQYFLTGSAEMRWKVDDGVLLIKAEEGTLRVSIPKWMELNSLRIISTSKDIELNDVDAEHVELLNADDDIKVRGIDSSVIKASAEGSIEWIGSTSGSAGFTSSKKIEIEDSTVSELSLKWEDDEASVTNTYADRVDAESYAGKLELRLTNGIATVRMNGKDISEYPSDRLGADVDYTTTEGEIRTYPGTVRAE